MRITLMGWFDAVVLNRNVLSLAIEAQYDVLRELPDYRPTLSARLHIASLSSGNMAI